MKKLLLITFCLVTCSLSAVITVTPSTTGRQTPVPQPTAKPLVNPVPLNAPKSKSPVKHSAHQRPASDEEMESSPLDVSFTLPGIIGLQGGQWKGTDHLLNLKNNIAVSADIMASKDVQAPFTEEAIKERLTALFIKAGLNPEAPTSSGMPPLPYLHFVIMLQPCGEEYGAFIQARLFEKVKLDRVVLPNEVVFQAITWEDENFIVMGKDDLRAEVFKQVDEMAEYFISRYNFFEKETFRMQEK